MKTFRNIAFGLLGVSIIFAGIYFGISYTLNDKFLFNTYINNTDCSLMTVAQANSVYTTNYYKNMSFDIIDNSNDIFEVTPELFDFSDAEKTDELLNNSNRNWIKSLIIPTMLYTNDGNAVDKTIEVIQNTWNIFDELQWKFPTDAYIEYDKDIDEFVIKSESIGNQINKEKFSELLKKHIESGEGDFTMSEIEGVYIEPKIKSDNEQLINLLNRLNNDTNYVITYDVYGNRQEFSRKDIAPYITIDYDKFDYTIDIDKCTDDFMHKMASHYNTLGITRDFKTTTGETVKVKGGDWGWWLNQKASATKLIEYINTGKSCNGEFIWLQEASYNLDNDFENYVEIDLTNQHLYMYKSGVLITESNIVSGCVSTNHNTPAGTYHLTYKTRNATLRGPGYASFVNYWMPFNGGIGMHDATWRSSFGGNIYKTNGSHGCINMPLSKAKEVYQNLDDTYAIICYWR